MYNHYFYTFNNYYNRQIKRYNTKAEYDAVAVNVGSKTANFEFKDGVNTTAGMTALQWNALSAIPDYMLLCDLTENTNILSRWFVIEATLECGGNYTLYLRRDLVADFYDVVVNAPAFIEKATLNTTDPLIWNSENMTYNQIKKGELALRDNTKMPWIVGYYALKNTEGEDQTSGPVSVGVADYQIDKEVADITTYTPYVLRNHTYETIQTTQLQVNAYRKNTQYRFFPSEGGKGTYTVAETSTSAREGYLFVPSYAPNGLDPLEYTAQAIGNSQVAFGYENAFMTAYNTQYGLSNETKNSLFEENFKVVKDNTTGKIYRVNIITSAILTKTQTREDLRKISGFSTVCDNTDLMAVGGCLQDEDEKEVLWQYISTYSTFTAKVEEITQTTGHYINIDPDRRALNDAPYCMFCIPYGNLTVKYQENSTYKQFISDKENALIIGAGLLANKPGYVYDVQILPYCPIEKVRRLIGNAGTIDLQELTDTIDYTRSAFSIKQVIFWAENSQGSIDLKYTHMSAEGVGYPMSHELLWRKPYKDWDPIDAKVMSECSMYRLCSPNYASQFEYNLSKNAGINPTGWMKNSVIFRVDYGYKPFTPYIKVSPIFGGLYGTNYNDARGLVLSGDFSITAITDKWQEYQLQNKNYQLAFDRQIENMEVQHKYAGIQDIANAVAGSVGGVGSGFATGFLASGGNPLVGAVGAGIQGAVSTGAGIADVIINKNLRSEAIDYTKDNFGFALGNIQALPNTLNKVSAINPNFRFFPVLEIYDATDDEKDALRQKLKYNGMTVGRINTISAYLQNEPTYIKAQLIRLEGIADDTHVLNELANEIMKGVYIAYVNTAISEPDSE